MKPNILIVTNGHLCRNPRVWKEASTLARAGYDVTVAGVRNHPRSALLDAQMVSGASFRHLEVNLLPGAGPAAFARRLGVKLWRDAASHFGWTSIHALGPARSLLALARTRPAALTIVHNEIAHWAGLRLAADGRRVAADIEDWHSEDLLPEHRRHRPLASLRRIEQCLPFICIHTTTTSQAMATAMYRRHGGAPPHVITNSFPLVAIPRPHRPRCPASQPRVLWMSQTIGPGRGLEEFVLAWAALATPAELRLVGEDQNSFANSLLARLPPTRRATVQLVPSLPPEKLPDEVALHDIGLALEPTTPLNKDLTISNKILLYLNAGLAVVATPTAGQREVLAHDSAAGVLLSLADPSAAARSLDSLLADRRALADRQAAARRLAEKIYCWEREAPRLLTLVASSLQSSNPSFPARPPPV